MRPAFELEILLDVGIVALDATCIELACLSIEALDATCSTQTELLMRMLKHQFWHCGQDTHKHLSGTIFQSSWCDLELAAS